MAEIHPKLAEVIATLTYDPMLIAQMLGWGWGGVLQGNAALPAGVAATAEYPIPDDEVWYRVNMVLSYRSADLTTPLPSSVLYTFRADGRTFKEDKVLLHAGFNEEISCPPGWIKGSREFSWYFENVTGNSTYNKLAAQTVWIQCTCFLFIIRKENQDAFEKLARRILLKTTGRSLGI